MLTERAAPDLDYGVWDLKVRVGVKFSDTDLGEVSTNALLAVVDPGATPPPGFPPVPGPPTYALLGLGMFGLLGYRLYHGRRG